MKTPPITPGQFPPNSTVTWCPHCKEPIHIEHRGLHDYYETELAAETHFRHYHRFRWWLWERFGWRRAISGL